MRKELKGFTKIFSFTFRQQVCRKGYLAATIIVALLCLAIPAGILTGVAWFGQEDGGTLEATVPEEDPAADLAQAELDEADRADMEAALDALQNIFVVNLTGSELFSASAIEEFDFEENLGVETPDINWMEYGEDFERARADSKGTGDTLLLAADRQADSFVINLLYPEDSSLNEYTADAVYPLLSGYGDWAAASVNRESGAGMEPGTGDGTGSTHAVSEGGSTESYGEGEEDPLEAMRDVLGNWLLPYLNIMVLYFFVLLYGQSVAQSVITEKSSKLMEFFLVSVRPTALIMGKLSAVCLSGVLQLFSWIACLAGGFALGYAGARAVDPETDMLLLQLLDTFGSLTGGMFSVGSAVVALLMAMAGMLLYCAMAGIGGAVAGKPEDLSSTNVLFTLVLVASFFACLFAGGLSGEGAISGWLDWVPFTSIMVTPARILVGSVPLAKGLGCLAVVLTAALLFTLLAGRIYKLMALYKGELPGPKKLIGILKQK